MLVKQKPVKLKLVGLDGNAFSLLGAFRSAARRQKWPAEDVKIVMDEAMSGDYSHLVGVLAEHCTNHGG
jgi:hypothetical protein